MHMKLISAAKSPTNRSFFLQHSLYHKSEMEIGFSHEELCETFTLHVLLRIVRTDKMG